MYCVIYESMQAGSGLIAFLPAPKGHQGHKKIGLQVTTSTTISKTAPSSLVPYSVTKKKAADEERKRQRLDQHKNANSDSEEDESVSFFSHIQSSTSKGISSDHLPPNAMSSSQSFNSSSIGPSTSFSSMTRQHPISPSAPSLSTIHHQSSVIVTPSSSTGETQYTYAADSMASYPSQSRYGQGGYNSQPNQDGSAMEPGTDIPTARRTAPATEWSAQGAGTPNQDDVLEMNEAAVSMGPIVSLLLHRNAIVLGQVCVCIALRILVLLITWPMYMCMYRTGVISP